MASKNEIFQRLKPHCIDLSQKALSVGRTPAAKKELVASLEILHRALQSASQSSNFADPKLAEYVFFPLSNVLRQSNVVPQRGLELAFECLLILLSTGWSKQIPKELGLQLLILLTFAAAGKTTPGNDDISQASEELRLVSFKCLSCLFQTFSGTPNARALTAEANLPTLAHAVTVILEGIPAGPSVSVQLAALSALHSFLDCIVDKEALASLFPGIVSSLTKTLQRDSRSKRSWKLLEGSLECLARAFRSMLDDEEVVPHIQQAASRQEASELKVTLTSAWLKATAGQVKLALTTIVQLRDHGRAEVRQALLELCRTILERCQQSLPDCMTLAVETTIALAGEHPVDEHTRTDQFLVRLASQNISIIDAIKSSQHAWVTALPRIVQSNDDAAKSRIVHQISASVQILSDLGVEPDILNDLLTVNLRDSVSAVINSRPNQVQVVPPSAGLVAPRDLLVNSDDRASMLFPSILATQKTQEETLSRLQVLAGTLSTSSSGPAIAGALTEYLQGASGDSAVASFWISLNMVRHVLGCNYRGDAENHGQLDSISSWMEILEMLYSHALSLVQTSWKDDQEDWRLQGLALETIALQAQQLQAEFQIELVEALYPVVHLIGSPNPPVRSHAMTCLNIIAESSGFRSAGDLIVENVDYLVNAVALKLNTFELSPQAPQVLLMMIKLAGPSLLPFLDDLMGSIFAALDNFHGYPRLVELLFSVLREIVDEGSRSSMPMIASGREHRHAKTPHRPRTVSEVADMFEQTAKDKSVSALSEGEEEQATEKGSFPREPWKNVLDSEAAKSEDEQQTGADLDLGDDQHNQDAQAVEKKPSPPSKTYSMLQSIARLSQHYLTHESARLRRDLLELTSTASMALQQDEDNFLPLVNDIWPVVIKRLYDTEPFVVVAAANAVASLCVAAGDFMSTRIETEWPALKALYWRVYPWRTTVPSSTKLQKGKAGRSDLVTRKPGTSSTTSRSPLTAIMPGKGIYTPAHQVWEALIHLIITVTEFVRIDEAIFDDILEMFADLLSTRPDLRDALAARNPDAVWLVLFLRQQEQRLEKKDEAETSIRGVPKQQQQQAPEEREEGRQEKTQLQQRRGNEHEEPGLEEEPRRQSVDERENGSQQQRALHENEGNDEPKGKEKDIEKERKGNMEEWLRIKETPYLEGYTFRPLPDLT